MSICVSQFSLQLFSVPSHSALAEWSTSTEQLTTSELVRDDIQTVVWSVIDTRSDNVVLE